MMHFSRNLMAAFLGALLLTVGMVFMMPTRVAVHADSLDGFEQAAAQIKSQFTQLSGELRGRSSGVLCADNKGLELIRSSIDKYESVGARSNKDATGASARTENFHLTTRLIACMLSPIPGDGARVGDKPGYVIYYGKKLVDAVATKFIDILSALALLAMTVMGIRLSLGYAHELQSATLTLLFKVALLYLALGSMPTLYMATVNTMNEMSGKIAAAIPTDMCPEIDNNIDKFKSLEGDRTFLLPWIKLDCAVESIATIILDSANSMVGSMVVAFLSGGMGKGLSVSFFAALLTLFETLNMAVFIIVLANLAVVLMFMIAPLTWVCILFKPTMKYFQKWTTLAIGFSLQPILLTLFLMMMITAFENVICKQSFSVVASFNAIKNGHITTDANGSSVSAATTADYGPEWCTRAKIQEATKRLVDVQMTHGARAQVIQASSEANQTDEFFQHMEGIFSDAMNIDIASFKNLIKGEGFTMAQMDVPQIYEKYVKLLSIPFQSMLAAFTVMFILFAFLKQLPNFINQLASASVSSGNLNQIKMQSMAHKGMKSMDVMTSGYSSGAMAQFGAMRTSGVEGMRNIPGSSGRGGSE